MVTALLAYPNTSKFPLAALLILQGCMFEVLHFFNGYRFGEWRDAAADALGVLLGLSLGALLKNYFSNTCNQFKFVIQTSHFGEFADAGCTVHQKNAVCL